jgi:hypothetical protein
MWLEGLELSVVRGCLRLRRCSMCIITFTSLQLLRPLRCSNSRYLSKCITTIITIITLHLFIINTVANKSQMPK